MLKFADDRAIRDNERKAALMHFTTDQAAEFSQSVASDEPKEKKTNPRVEHIRTLGRPFGKIVVLIIILYKIFLFRIFLNNLMLLFD